MSNREELTRQAEKHLRLGRVDDAITLFQELAYLAPVDWGVVKQLADLLERAGQREGAARQFTRWADYLFAEGFHSKAAALYKKILKLEGADEHALWQLGEVSVALKLRADARIAFQRVLEIRQRRGDSDGAAVARERLATLESMSAGAAGVAMVPARWPAPVEAPPAPAPASVQDAPAPVPTPEPPVAPTVAPAAVPVPVVAPQPAPVVAAAPPSVALTPTLVSAPAPAPTPAVERIAIPVAPPETAEARLARLRRDALVADARQAPDADRYWLAVLDADPGDADLRLRLVLSAAGRGDLETARRLATVLALDSLPAFVGLAELSHRQRRLDVLEQLVSERLHGGAGDAVLAALDQIAAHDEAAARAVLTAAVDVWLANAQPSAACAAMEQAAAHGWLTTALCVRWVEICVDNALPTLSTAQSALTRAYIGEGRLHEARRLAEDIYVRDVGVEPAHSLLLEVLERQGVGDKAQVLVDLLAPPALRDAEQEAAAPAIADVLATGFAAETWAADTVPAPAAPEVATSVELMHAIDALAVEPLAVEPMVTLDQPPIQAVEDVAPAPAAAAAGPSFDWAYLLGRDEAAQHAEPHGAVGAAPELPAPVAAPVEEAALVAVDADPEPPALESVPVAAAANIVDETPTAPPSVTVETAAPVPPAPPEIARPATPEAEAAPASPSPRDERSPFFTASPAPRIGDLRGQPLFADAAPLQPSFSMPSSWLSPTPQPLPPDAPRRREPGDDFFFDDDATLPKWVAPTIRASATPNAAAPLTPAATPDSPQPEDVHVLLPEEQLTEDLPAAVESEPATIEADVVPMAITPVELTEIDTQAAVIEVTDVAAPEAEVSQPSPRDDEDYDEVDLTELLEALKQWDPALPEPRRDTPDEPVAEAEPSVQAAPALESRPDDRAEPEVAPEPAAAPDVEGAEAGDPLPEPAPIGADDGRAELDAVFADLQRQGDERTVAEQQLAAGRVFLAAGLVSEAARAFERASAEPRTRYEATLALGELHKSRGQLLEAISWFEHAAMAPVPDAAVKRAVLYDLAESLEALGEGDRALGVLLDLLSQVEDYRDARARLDRLLRVDAGG